MCPMKSRISADAVLDQPHVKADSFGKSMQLVSRLTELYVSAQLSFSCFSSGVSGVSGEFRRVRLGLWILFDARFLTAAARDPI